MDFDTEICKDCGVEGSRVGEMSMSVDYGTKVKHLNKG